jgi:hypothetical protein
MGGPCSLATHRSRGCRASLASRSVAPEVFEEVRGLLEVIASGAGDEEIRGAAVRLAEIVRREARDDRNLVAQAQGDDPELAAALARLCRRPGAQSSKP